MESRFFIIALLYGAERKRMALKGKEIPACAGMTRFQREWERI
jgi:hypothetical protein